jgi:hypothetical protein
MIMIINSPIKITLKNNLRLKLSTFHNPTNKDLVNEELAAMQNT